ncbi:MAG: protein phosphatase CheZ [Desulfotignum sp.]|nr:protein phosphatase CheZ [Desulfotignum sp.]MCF8136450.1 protein phosphatase CheZ [Desulfotignum sp.]
MTSDYKAEIINIVSGKLSESEVEELTFFFKQAVSHAMDQDDEAFYRSVTTEMSGNVKELALVLINFRKDFTQKIRPHIEDIANVFIPQTSDQLEGIIETTEQAANTIMDNLDRMNQMVAENKSLITAMQNGTVNGGILAPDVVADLAPTLDVLAKHNGEYLDLITDTFTQMSFQDLTGQRLQRIIKLVGEIEEKITKMVISFGLKLTVREKNPELSAEELQKKVDEQAQLLAGPQKKGGGLDQDGIDDLLNSF